jgi:leucyl-tRNA synthetase
VWSGLGHADSVVDCRWPQADQAALIRDSIELVVQVNGKMRGRITVAANAADEDIRAAALAEPNVQRFMQGKQLRKVIIVPRRLANVVVG